MIRIGTGLVHHETTWINLKSIINQKILELQYVEESNYYFIYVVDNVIVHSCIIYTGTIPEVSDTTQEQNDLDKQDFEDNYKDILTNNSLIKKSSLGVNASASSKGLGGFVPEPTNNPYEPSVDENVSLYVDGEGSLVTRSGIITDEGSFRDDFTNSIITNLTGTLEFVEGSNEIIGSGSIFTEELNRDYYIKYILDGYESWAKVLRVKDDSHVLIDSAYNGSTTTGIGVKTHWIEIKNGSGETFVINSKIDLDIGTDSDGYVYLKKFADYAPMIQFWRVAVDNRVNNQEIFFGFRDDIDNPNMLCDVILTGTNNKIIKFRSGWNGDIEETNIELHSNLTTSSFIKYKIDVAPDYCSLIINGALVAKHDSHIPGMYDEMDAVCGIKNTGTTSQSVKLQLDSFFISNQNQIQIANSFSNPISIITREDQHTLCGKLTTTSVTSNQVILEYTVPNNKIFCIIGYRINSSGTADGAPIKITTDPDALEPNYPGVVDGEIFRIFNLTANSSTGDIDFSIPRRIASGGETIYVTVTPTSTLSTVWRANIDFVLR